jgi:DnaJ-class molecular chaperone
MLKPEPGAAAAPCQQCKGARTTTVVVKGVEKKVPCQKCRGTGSASGSAYLTK